MPDRRPARRLNLMQEALQELGQSVAAAGDAERSRQRRRDRAHQHAAAAVSRRAAGGAAGRLALDRAADAPLATTAHHLLDDTDAAIARQTLLQVASLPDRVDLAESARSTPAAPRWNFEIPFATPQGTAMAQFEISRDGGADEVEAAKRVWRARFSLDVEPAGPVHALVSLTGDKTSVRMWAERPATAAQLRAGAAAIEPGAEPRRAQPGDIVIRDGAPPQAARRPRRAFSGSRAMSVEAKSQLAVALHYDHTGAPRVVAKGKGTIGAKIIEIAKAHDIPIEENEVLAGALSKVELGDEIPAELYKAVAEVLVFVLAAVGADSLGALWLRAKCGPGIASLRTHLNITILAASGMSLFYHDAVASFAVSNQFGYLP